MERGTSQEQKMVVGTSHDRVRKSSELVFLDVETTVPVKKEKRFRMLEFGAIVVCPKKLVEKRSYSTLIRPGDLSVVPENSGRSDGITREAVAAAPKFEEVAGSIYGILHGKVWVGHNILRFDKARIREAFAEIGHPAPKPVGMIDSLDILMNKFGPRAGNMKMASLAAYFGLGKQKHRYLSLERSIDVKIQILCMQKLGRCKDETASYQMLCDHIVLGIQPSEHAICKRHWLSKCLN